MWTTVSQRADRSANGINRVSWPTTSGSPHGSGHRMYLPKALLRCRGAGAVHSMKVPLDAKTAPHVHSCTDNELGFYYARRVISSRP